MLCIALFLTCMIGWTSAAEADDGWRQNESAHFVIVYPENLTLFADAVLSKAEAAYAKISEGLDFELDFRVTIEVVSTRDEELPCSRSVGMQRFSITPWPDDDSLFGHSSGDWIERQVAHKLTHIVTANTTKLKGYNKSVFGIITHMNRFSPKWYLEGAAHYYETPNEPGRSAREPALIKLIESMARDELIPSVNEMTAGLRRWPTYEAESWLGAAFIASLVEGVDADMFARWNYAHASSFQPFMIQSLSVLLFGETWTVFYDTWRNRVGREASARAEFSEETEHEVLTEAWRNDRVQALPLSKDISYVRVNGVLPQAVVTRDNETGRENKIVECVGRCEHHWAQDGAKLYYTSLYEDERHTRSERLFVYEPKTRKDRELAVPKHVRDFDVDGAWLWAVVMEHEHTVLYRYDLQTEGAKAQRVFATEPFERIDSLDVRGDRIVASVYDPTTYRTQIEVFDVDGERVTRTRLTNDEVQHTQPFWLNDEEIGYIRTDAWTESVWMLSADGARESELVPLREVVAHPVMAPDGRFLYTQYDGHGASIAAVSVETMDALIERAHQFGTAPTLAALTDSKSYTIEVDAIEVTDEETFKPSTKEYRVLKQLLPSDGMPRFGYTKFEGVNVGLVLYGKDKLNRHEYSVGAEYLTGLNHANFSFDYHWLEYPWTLNVSAGLVHMPLANEIENRSGASFSELSYMTHWAEAATERTWHYPSIDIGLKLGYRVEYNDAMYPEVWNDYVASNDEYFIPELSWTSAIFAELELSHMSHEERLFVSQIGYYASLGLRVESPYIAASNNTFIVAAELRGDWLMPWHYGHSLTLDVRGGYSVSDNDLRIPFSLQSDSSFTFGRRSVIHGYDEGSVYGRYYVYGHAGYTALLAEFGGTDLCMPFALNRIGMKVFGEWASAWTQGDFDRNQKFAVGGELIFDFRMSYQVPVRISYGFAYGFNRHGGQQHYILFGN